ncbi:unnamed protein product [Phytomonas sp. EM1]|nr:unnamed protein product [Phytomonas sp. EM1]|eukprot:CCW61479.1 unnamed protein product [Phytomonas sp. isolate EM1]
MVLSSINIPAVVFLKELSGLLRKYYDLRVTIITSARVPLVKLYSEGIAVDIVFASTALPTPPTTEQLLCDNFLLYVSIESRPSVNGIRTVLEIKQSLPVDYDVYVTTLKAVKRWAMKRLVYGNLFTFPNGVTLAIMVCYICQTFPHNSPSFLFRYFFSYFAEFLPSHVFPSIPIFITLSLQQKKIRIDGIPRCWSSNRASCKEEIFPVLNPAYPYVNAAHSVGRCGLQYFYDEIVRAQQLLFLHPKRIPMDQIWEPYSICKNFRQFVAIHVSCIAMVEEDCESALNIWKGLIESKLRFFVYAIERTVDVRPFPKVFSSSSKLDDSQNGAHLRKCVYFFAVKPRESVESSKLHSLSLVSHDFVASCFAELIFAVREGINPSPGGQLPYQPQIMVDPSFSLHCVSDDNFVNEFGDHLK